MMGYAVRMYPIEVVGARPVYILMMFRYSAEFTFVPAGAKCKDPPHDK